MNIAIHDIKHIDIGNMRYFSSDGRMVYTIAITVDYTDIYGKEVTQAINFYSDEPVFEENNE